MALAQLKHETGIYEDETGVLRISGTRVVLDLVVRAFQKGASPEEIVWRYDSLKLADVYAAISYYLQNQDELDVYFEKRDKDAEEVRQKINAHWEKSELRKKLLAARADR